MRRRICCGGDRCLLPIRASVFAPAANAEFVALRIGEQHPTLAVGEAVVGHESGTQLEQAIHLLVARPLRRGEIQAQAAGPARRLRRLHEEHVRPRAWADKQPLRVIGLVPVLRVLLKIGDLGPEGDQRVRVLAVNGDVLDAHGYGILESEEGSRNRPRRSISGCT